MTNLTMRPMQSQEDADAFRALNEAWITKLFRLEEKDRTTLNDPHTTILANGGQVYVAEIDGHVVGAAAWVRYGEGIYELSKMAVDSAVRGQGIGRKLLLYMIDQARSLGARTLFLGSSKKLQNAVHLYEAVGFHHVPPSELPEMKYDRADVFMKMEMPPLSVV